MQYYMVQKKALAVIIVLSAICMSNVARASQYPCRYQEYNRSLAKNKSLIRSGYAGVMAASVFPIMIDVMREAAGRRSVSLLIKAKNGACVVGLMAALPIYSGVTSDFINRCPTTSISYNLYCITREPYYLMVERPAESLTIYQEKHK